MLPSYENRSQIVWKDAPLSWVEEILNGAHYQPKKLNYSTGLRGFMEGTFEWEPRMNLLRQGYDEKSSTFAQRLDEEIRRKSKFTNLSLYRRLLSIACEEPQTSPVTYEELTTVWNGYYAVFAFEWVSYLLMFNGNAHKAFQQYLFDNASANKNHEYHIHTFISTPYSFYFDANIQSDFGSYNAKKITPIPENPNDFNFYFTKESSFRFILSVIEGVINNTHTNVPEKYYDYLYRFMKIFAQANIFSVAQTQFEKYLEDIVGHPRGNPYGGEYSRGDYNCCFTTSNDGVISNNLLKIYYIEKQLWASYNLPYLSYLFKFPPVSKRTYWECLKMLDSITITYQDYYKNLRTVLPTYGFYSTEYAQRRYLKNFSVPMNKNQVHSLYVQWRDSFNVESPIFRKLLENAKAMYEFQNKPVERPSGYSYYEEDHGWIV